MNRFLALLAFCLCLASSEALAHAQLLHAMPPVGSTVSAPVKEVRLEFSEGVEIKFSTAELTLVDGTAIKTTLALSPDDAKIMVLTPEKPLDANRYELAWHVVSQDTHRTQGHFSFTVEP